MARESEYAANERLASCCSDSCRQGRAVCKTPKRCASGAPSVHKSFIVVIALVMLAVLAGLHLSGWAS